jgi:hypothetical protein
MAAEMAAARFCNEQTLDRREGKKSLASELFQGISGEFHRACHHTEKHPAIR